MSKTAILISHACVQNNLKWAALKMVFNQFCNLYWITTAKAGFEKRSWRSNGASMNHTISVFLSQCVSDQLQSVDRWSKRSEGLEWHSVHAEKLGLENMEAVIYRLPPLLHAFLCVWVGVHVHCFFFAVLYFIHCVHTHIKPTTVKCTQINRPPSDSYRVSAILPDLLCYQVLCVYGTIHDHKLNSLKTG